MSSFITHALLPSCLRPTASTFAEQALPLRLPPLHTLTGSVEAGALLQPCIFWFDSQHLAHVQRYLEIYDPFVNMPDDMKYPLGWKFVKVWGAGRRITGNWCWIRSLPACGVQGQGWSVLGREFVGCRGGNRGGAQEGWYRAEIPFRL